MHGFQAARRILQQISGIESLLKFALDRIPQPFVGGPEFTLLELRQGEIVRVVSSR